MIARICNFQVGLCRGQKDAAIRTVDLFVECDDDPNVRRVFLRYFDKKQDSLGFVNSVKDNLLVFLPLEDFELTRQLLAGDAEVYFAWIADVEGKLVWAEITTAQEPLRSCHLEGSQGIHLVPSEDRQVTSTALEQNAVST